MRVCVCACTNPVLLCVYKKSLYNLQARLDILRIHSRKMNLTRGINLRKIAEAMPGASGAEIKGVCTEAGMYALRERRVHVTQEDFEMAVAKVSVRLCVIKIKIISLSLSYFRLCRRILKRICQLKNCGSNTYHYCVCIAG